MKKFLLTVLTFCLLLCVFVSPVRALGEQQMLPAHSMPMTTVHGQCGCKVLQDQLAQIRHLLQFSRLYPGDDSLDQQVVVTRISTRASLLKQLSQAQMKLLACLSSSAATA
jgi:hypothetical protein